MASLIFSRFLNGFGELVLQTAFFGLFFLGSVTFAFADAPPPTLTSVTIASNNASTTLAKAGNVATLSFTGSRNLDSNPVVSIGGTTSGVTVASVGSQRDWIAYRTITATDASGILSFQIEFSSNAVVGVPVTATTDGSSVTIDTTAPTAALSFSAGTVHNGDSLTIAATLSEPIVDSPVLALSLFGANTLATTTFVKTDSTHYSYIYTVGGGNGTTTVALGAATDLAGNVVASAPTSGASFFVENIPPTITGATIISGNQLTVSFSEPITSTTTDYSGLTLIPGGARSLIGVVASSSQSITLFFDGAAAALSATGTVAVGSSVRDLVGNSLVASTTVLSDGQAPLAPGTPTLSSGTALIGAARESAGIAVTAPLSLSGAVAGDRMELLRNHTSFPSSLLRTLTATEIISGSVVFAIEHGQLGSDGTKAVSARLTDSAGNIGAESGALTLTLDTASPTLASATITGANQITLAYSESVFSTTTDYATLLLSGGESRTITATTGSSTATILLSFSGAAVVSSATGTVAIGNAVTDSAGNALIATTTVLTDGQSPTAALSYSKNPVKAGDSLVITATLSEPILDSPVLALSLFGANTLATTTLTKTDSTHYSFAHTVGAGNGTTTVALGAATDVAGNIIVSAPTSGAEFFVDNIAPTAAASFSKSPVKAGDITVISFTTSEPIDAATSLLISFGGANTVSATSTTRADSTHFSFSYTVGLGDGAAVLALSNGADSAGNAITATPSSGASFVIDNTAPTITVANPGSAPAHSKTVTAAASDGILTQSITTGAVCNETLSFSAYASTTFAAEADNGKRICYRALDTAGNGAYLFSDPIAGIDFTPPAISALSLSPSSGTRKVGDAITLSVTADAVGYLFGAILINGAATTSMRDAGAGIYFATTTVVEGDSDRVAGAVPVEVVFVDAAGNRNATSTTVAANTLAIDAHAPTLVSARTTSTTTIEVSFSENLNGATVTNADFAVAGNTLTSPDAFESSVGIVRLTLGTPLGTADTPAVSLTGMVQDLAGNIAPVAGPITSTDGVAPVITVAPYSLALTNQDITVSASAPEGLLNASSHLFTANGSFGFVATDATGNAATTTITITNIDKTAPVIAAHDAVTIEATSTLGALGSYTAPSATDAVDGATTVVCTPASGIQFVLGATTISCTSTDSAGNSATVAFVVNVVDTTAPSLTPPSPQTFEATAVLSAPTLTLASATDAVSTTTITLSYSPTSFPVGATVVSWTARDGAGNSATATSSVTIRDTTAPTIALHETVSAPAESATGATLTYTPPSATDLASGAVGVLCSPSSGTKFAIGTTTIICSAVDARQNVATSSFAVVVTREIPLIGAVSVNPGAPDIVVRAGTTATSTIAIPSGVSASRLNLAALLVSGTSTRRASIGGAVMVATQTSAGSVALALPQGLEIRGGSVWDGALLLPRASAASPTPPSPSSGMSAAVSQVIEIGSEGAELALSRAARLLLPGVAGHLVGSTRSGTAFTPITQVCVSDEQTAIDAQLGSTTPSACKISVGNDLAVWTNHFTSFVTYTEAPLPPAPSFRGGNGPIMSAAPRAGAGNYGVPISAAAPVAPVPQATAPVSFAPAAAAVLPAAPQPVSPVRVALEQGRGANQSGTVSIPALTAAAQAKGTEVKKAEARAALVATTTPNNLAKERTKTVSSAPSFQELAAAAVSAESNGVITRIKKGWSAFVQKIRSLRR